MRIAVDLNRCENHGQCAYSAPEVFALDDNGELTLRAEAQDEYSSGEFGDALREELEEAIDMCPVQAIRFIDDEG
jgi:ferredoxin